MIYDIYTVTKNFIRIISLKLHFFFYFSIWNIKAISTYLDDILMTMVMTSYNYDSMTILESLNNECKCYIANIPNKREFDEELEGKELEEELEEEIDKFYGI